MALMRVDFFSETLGMCVEMDVILPQPKNPADAKPWQTLYLLHGMMGDHTAWQRWTSIERYAQEYELAVIMPSTQLGWYTNMHIGPKWFDYVAKELPATCRKFFRLSESREDTFVAGLSMGGYGAIKLGLAATDTFSHAATLSGAMDIADTCRHALVSPDLDEKYWSDVFGPLDAVEGTENDLFKLAADSKASGLMPRIYQWCGTEDFLYQYNVRFRDHLKSLGFDFVYEEGPGDHQWKYWDVGIQRVLDWLPLRKLKKEG